MYKNLVILISGAQGAGKTTLANKISHWALDDNRFWVYNLKFADTLYEMHHAIWGILEKEGEMRPAKVDGTLLQLLGTEWGRRCLDSYVWVRILKKKVLRAVEFVRWPRHKIFIIDDARMINEISAFDREPGIETLKVRLECNEGMRQARALKWRANTAHESETGLDEYKEFDYIIYTDTHNEADTFELVKGLIEKRF